MEQEQKQILTREDYTLLFSELEHVCEKGLISSETLDAIRGRYKPKEKSTSFRSLIFMTSLLLGVVALGFALYITLDEYWRTLSETVRTALVVTPFAASYAGYFVSAIRKKELASQAFLFAGCGFFFLLGAHMFSTFATWFDANRPLLWLFAAVTTFVAAFFSHYKSLHSLAIFFIGALLCSCADYHTPLFGDRGCFLVLPMIAAGLYWSYRRASSVVGMGYYLLFGFWAFLQFGFWDAYFEYFLPFLIVVMGSAFALFGLYCRRAGIFRPGLPVIAYLFVLIALPHLTYVDFYTRVARYVEPNWADYYVVLGIGTAIGVLSLVLLRLLEKRGDAPTSRPVLNSLLAILSPEGIGVATLPLFVAVSLSFDSELELALVFAAYANVLMVGVAARFIWVGAKDSPFQFWIGVVYFIVWMFLRMLSFISTYDDEKTLFAILFFFVIAVVLFMASYVFYRFVKTEEKRIEIAEKPALREPKDVVPELARKIGVCAAILLQFALTLVAPFI